MSTYLKKKAEERKPHPHPDHWLDIPIIEVKDPMEHNTWDKGRYTTYRIVITTNHPSFNLKSSSVRRRFSEVVWLRNVLKTIHTSIKIPKAPPKKFTGGRFSPQFIKTRQTAIADFLNEVIKTETLLSDTAVHLFLQSDLTTAEIDDYFKGNISQNVMDQVWTHGGILHKPERVQESFGEMQQISEASDQGCFQLLNEVSEYIPTPNQGLSSSSSSTNGSCDPDSVVSSVSDSSSVERIDERMDSLANSHGVERMDSIENSHGVRVTTVVEINSINSDSSSAGNII